MGVTKHFVQESKQVELGTKLNDVGLAFHEYQKIKHPIKAT
jgi:hypothetical protein